MAEIGPDTSNMKLLTYTKRVNPAARIVVTAESILMPQKPCTSGADSVLLPLVEVADILISLLEELITSQAPDTCIEDCV